MNLHEQILELQKELRMVAQQGRECEHHYKYSMAYLNRRRGQLLREIERLETVHREMLAVELDW